VPVGSLLLTFRDSVSVPSSSGHDIQEEYMSRWKNCITNDIMEMECSDVAWTEVNQDTVQ